MELHSATSRVSGPPNHKNTRISEPPRTQDNSEAALPAESYAPGVEQSVSPTYLAPLLPQAGKDYVVSVEETPVMVRFDAKAIAFFETIGHKVDLQNAQLVGPNGTTHSLDSRVSARPSPAEQYQLASGEKSASDSAPWTFRVPGMPGGVFGKPQGVEFLGRESGLGMEFLNREGQFLTGGADAPVLDDFQEFRTDTKVLRRDRLSSAKALLASSSSSTESFDGEFLHAEPLPGLRFQAPNQQSLDRAQAGFESVLGHSSRTRAESVDLDKLKAFESTFQSLLEREQAENSEVDGFAVLHGSAHDPRAADELRAILGEGSEQLAAGELLQAVRTKVQRACPLEIVVIPRGKTAADCIENADDQTRHQLKNVGRAYFHMTDPIAYRMQTGNDDLPAQRLFIGEEVLADETAVKVVYKHEMLHVFEHRYASPDETKALQQSFTEATEFQSLYGSSFSEYLPTIGEEFLASYGAEGPQWVQEQHPRVYDMLSNLIASDKG